MAVFPSKTSVRSSPDFAMQQTTMHAASLTTRINPEIFLDVSLEAQVSKPLPCFSCSTRTRNPLPHLQTLLLQVCVPLAFFLGFVFCWLFVAVGGRSLRTLGRMFFYLCVNFRHGETKIWGVRAAQQIGG